MELWGFHLTQMNSMVLETHLVVVIHPKPLFLIILLGFPVFLENWGSPCITPGLVTNLDHQHLAALMLGVNPRDLILSE